MTWYAAGELYRPTWHGAGTALRARPRLFPRESPAAPYPAGSGYLDARSTAVAVAGTDVRACHEEIRLTGVTRRYDDVVVVDRVDLDVPRGRRLAVVGPSGCGKSDAAWPDRRASSRTRASSMSRSNQTGRPAGPVRVDAAARSAAAVAIRAGERGGLAGEPGDLAPSGPSAVRPLFERFGLAGFEDHHPRQLSGGMRQRVAFLRTFVASKEVLLLDEPFGALDAITRTEAQDWLRAALEAEPRTVVLVTHDVEEALLLGHEIVVLTGRPGRVAARYAVDLPAATRRELLATPEFILLRDQVLAALEKRPSAPEPVTPVEHGADGSPNPMRQAEG